MRLGICSVLMLSPFAVHQANDLGTRAVKRIGVDINVVDGIGEGGEAEAVGKPVRKVVGAELQAQARAYEMKVEAGVANRGDTFAKLVESPRPQRKGGGHFQAFAKKETVQGLLAAESGKRGDELPQHAAEIIAQSRDGGVIANVQGRELLGKRVAVGFREGPLREVVGKTLGKEMVRT